MPCRASRVVPVPSCKVGSNNTALINFNTRFFLFIFAHHNVLILSRTELSFFRWRRALLYFWGSLFSSGSYSFAGRFFQELNNSGRSYLLGLMAISMWPVTFKASLSSGVPAFRKLLLSGGRIFLTGDRLFRGRCLRGSLVSSAGDRTVPGFVTFGGGCCRMLLLSGGFVSFRGLLRWLMVTFRGSHVLFGGLLP